VGDIDDASKDGGDPACWLHLVCADCGAVLDAEHHCLDVVRPSDAEG
jgi:hypothetical protein